MTDLLHSPDQHQNVLRSGKRGRNDMYNDIGITHITNYSYDYNSYYY